MISNEGQFLFFEVSERLSSARTDRRVFALFASEDSVPTVFAGVAAIEHEAF